MFLRNSRRRRRIPPTEFSTGRWKA